MKLPFRFFLLSIVLLLVFATAGCSNNSNKYAAVVNGEGITLEDFNREVEKQSADQNKNKEKEPNKAQLKKEVLDRMILQKIELQEARIKKLLLSDKEVDKKIDELKVLYKSEDNFKKMLQAQNISLEKYKENIKYQLSKEILFNEITKAVTVTDTDMVKYYQENPQATLKQKARLILVSSQNRSDAEAKSIAGDIAKQLADGASFDQLARSRSDDKSTADAGGQMLNRTNLDDPKHIYRGQMGVEIDNALNKLKPGEYTREPFKASQGYKFVMLEDLKQMNKEELKGIYQGRLLQQSKLKVYNEFILAAKTKARIKIYSDKN